MIQFTKDNIMIYPSGLLMAKVLRGTGAGEGRVQRISYTKHYYIGAERISSKTRQSKYLADFPVEIASFFPQLNTATLRAASNQSVTDAGTQLAGVYSKFDMASPPLQPKIEDVYKTGDFDGNPPLAFYFHPDHLGSSTYISNDLGQVSQHAEYLPFGELLVDEHKNSNNSPFKFNGKLIDEETGNYYYGARYYDPKWSNFISVDPLAEKTMDAYGYCYQNPINLVDPDGRAADDWVEKKDGTIYWDKNATSQKTAKEGETYLGKNVLVATHNRDENLNEPINSAKFELYLESDTSGPSATIFGNTVPADVSKSGTLAEGLYSAKFGHRNKEKYKNELAIRIYNLNGTDGLPTVNGNPNPASDGKTLTGVLFHMGNNNQESLFDSKGNAYSHGCQTGGNYKGSVADHNSFMRTAGKNFSGTYYLRSKPSEASGNPFQSFSQFDLSTPFKP